MSTISATHTAFRRVHFIGIGGIGISGLARLFHSEGKVVTGTNDNPSPNTLDALREMGVEISLDTTVLPEADLYVYSEAWHHLNPMLLKRAFDSGVPCINYFEALGMVANQYRLIAVSGSHGKTTTTAMLIDVFERAGLDPTAIVGSLRAATHSNYRKGKGNYFIAEACEYRRDFLSLTPDVLVITNIELEHVDYYKTLEDVQAAFIAFAAQIRDGGTLVANLSDPAVQPIVSSVAGKGVNVVDYTKYFDPLMQLTVPGIHNRLNAAAARAVAHTASIPTNVADAALADFRGTWRRFEYKGEVNGAKVYDDYGHHPAEIAATIKGARELYPDRLLTIIFQSHTYTRTHALFAEFADALALADRVRILPIYAAREDNESGVTHTALAKAVEERQKDVRTYETFEEAVDDLKPKLSSEDVVLVMGAGDVTEVARLLTT